MIVLPPQVRHAADETGTLRASVLAPAKLNLLLAVGGQRADGYHEVVTVLQTLDLADRVEVDVLPTGVGGEVDVLVEAPGVPGGDTLVTGAVRLLLDVAGIGGRVWVTIDKHVPVGGGLGGGSSDAAAALRVVNDLLGRPLDAAGLTRVAAQVGSDVPFFLLGPGSAALATGRGEVVRPVAAPSPRAWLLANPGVHQSTAAVYERHDPAGVAELPSEEAEALAQARSGRPRNDLAVAARAASEQLDRLCGALEDAGVVPLVCGSGATVAVRLRSGEERRALEGVCRAAAPGCWLRQAWTTVAAHG
jgi:4-diphosphocytidyl-2-C-methyl-D-erythritol kinase